jgi:hypothetical protein
MERRAVPGALWVGVAAAAVLTGCSTPVDAPVSPPTVQAAPPAPPAACLLDPARLAADTGLTWIPDQTTASDTRCVYDPGGPVPPAPSASPTGAPDPVDFLAVEVAPAVADDAQTELDGVAGACADGSRAPAPDDGNGFVCRFRGGSVFAAAVRAGQLVTVSVSAVPDGTTTARLVLALQQQLDGLGH